MTIRTYMNIITEAETTEPINELFGFGKPKRDPDYDEYHPESQEIIDQYATGKSPAKYDKPISEIDNHPLYPKLKYAASWAWNDKYDPSKTLWDEALGYAEEIAKTSGYSALYIRRYASMSTFR